MNFSEKIVTLRKSRGMSQEALAEELEVSRQAISRWEMGTAMPDAANILRISKLFHVTTDYLLHDEYESDNDLPKVKEVKTDKTYQIMIYLVTLEIMILLMQFICICILQNVFFGVLTMLPFIAGIGGFEYAYQKNAKERTEQTRAFRKRFYKISAWLGAYYPVRLIVMILIPLYPRPYQMWILECLILIIYLAAAALINLEIEKRCD